MSTILKKLVSLPFSLSYKTLGVLKSGACFLLNKMKKRKILSSVVIFGLFSYSNELKLKLCGKKYRVDQCDKALSERFSKQGKYYFRRTGEHPLLICTINPTNQYDLQAILEIANKFSIPICIDCNETQGHVNSEYIALDYTNYNQLIKLDFPNHRITVQPGVKVSDLVKVLDENGFTLGFFNNSSQYEDESLLIKDVLYNNYNGYNAGRFIDDFIANLKVVIPNKVTTLSVRENDDMTMSGLNLKNLFIRSNFILGIVSELTLKLEKKTETDFFSINEDFENIYSCIDFLDTNAPKLRDNKLLNIVFSKKFEKGLSTSQYRIGVVVKEPQLVDHAILPSNLTKLNDDNSPHKTGEYFFNTLKRKSIAKKLKIRVPKESFKTLISKIEKYSERHKVKVEMYCWYSTSELVMFVLKDNNASDKEAMSFLDSLHSAVLKLEGNIFANSHINSNTKYHLMRDLGVASYYINGDIKRLFDPSSILNPHLSISKPDPLKYLRRTNKYFNYYYSRLRLNLI